LKKTAENSFASVGAGILTGWTGLQRLQDERRESIVAVEIFIGLWGLPTIGDCWWQVWYSRGALCADNIAVINTGPAIFSRARPGQKN
jgi:hypothetical protein